MGLEKEDSVEDFNTLERDFVTWESNQIYNDDLQFISVDFILARIESLKQQRLMLDNSLEYDNDLRVIIKELTDLIK